MRFSSFKTLALAGTLAVLGAGCDGLLDTEPRQSVSPEVGLSDLSGVQGILTSAYNRLQDVDTYGQRQIIAPEILADNAAINDNPSGRYRGESTNEIGTGVGGWTQWYRVISDANYVLYGLTRVDAPEATRNRMRGEALFLRALAHHNLARIYAYEPGREVNGFTQGVILRTQPTLALSEVDFRSRNSVQEVYQQIESDLLEAIQLLTASGGTNRYFATRGAAEGLLARVYLYAGRWADAEARATNALAPTTTAARLATVAQVPTMFRTQPNPESLFEIAINGTTETLGVNNAINPITTPARWFDVVPSAELQALYEPTDARLAGWYAAGGATGRYSTKFPGSVAVYTDHVPVLRVAEMLLIRAEARARQGNTAGAFADLNTLRAARAATPFDGSGDVIALVMDERRRELAFEGHRWFDLKRLGMDIPKAARTAAPAVPYANFRILAPIPTAQVDLNPNLTQNPGY
ncbi:MAG: RagB/SusD family nutrient uptake outer membrane protein [Rubricoccaceae bacterium]